MSLSSSQSRQIAVLLGYAFTEMRLRHSQNNHVAVSDLIDACHNLPAFQVGSDHFDWHYFRRWFTRFHELHGMALFNYLKMLDTIEKGADLSIDIARTPLGEITPIAHEFITWKRPENA
jgi:hypothetical protein